MKVCTFCKNTGKNGARFVLLVDGEAYGDVHRPCGNRLAETAPKGTAVEVLHFREYRRRTEEAQTRAFWEKKFSQARSRKAKGGKGGT